MVPVITSKTPSDLPLEPPKQEDTPTLLDGAWVVGKSQLAEPTKQEDAPTLLEEVLRVGAEDGG